ncbi:hypothetical protein ACPA54_11585 [Uniformispora flossi]|uniref:hypothetical protein n=1 Tax=Uniformispora flossi TaxID=3390723 RepID=UPI003C2E16F1
MIILDTGAVTALARGHKTLNLLAAMARTPADRLTIPAPCLMQAEAREQGLYPRMLAYSAVTVDDLGSTAAATVGTMIRDGHGAPDTCHALYCALPHAEFAGMSILLTDNEDAYPPGINAVDIDSPGMLGFS